MSHPYRQCPNGGFLRADAVPNFQCIGECAPLTCGPTIVPDEHLAVSATNMQLCCTDGVTLENPQPKNQAVHVHKPLSQNQFCILSYDVVLLGEIYVTAKCFFFICLQSCVSCNSFGTNCQNTAPGGSGVAADFILYVAASGQEPCAQSTVGAQTIAFASHCQLEPTLDRLDLHAL